MAHQLKKIRLIYLLVVSVLTLLFGISLYWNINNTYKNAYEFAEVEANASFNKDVLYRRWASLHGGVYVPVSEHTPPNPGLAHIPYRDIIVPETKTHLTLVNPAYMTRQVLELGNEQYGVQGHITSLNPLREMNYADPWEVEALKKFDERVEELSEIVEMDGERFLRYMSVMKVEEGCMKCHEIQGYQIGQVRGGVSVSVPLDKYDVIASKRVRQLTSSHLLIYLVVLGSSLWGYRRIQTEVIEKAGMQEKINQSLENLQIRNSELKQAEQKMMYWQQLLQYVVRHDPIAIAVLDKNLHFIYVSEKFLLDYKVQEKNVIGRHHYDVLPEIPQKWKDVHQQALQGKILASDDDFFERPGGVIDHTRWECRPWHDMDGSIGGIILYTELINERKKSEQALRESEEKFRTLFEEHSIVKLIIDPSDGQIIDANKAAAKFYGWSIEELKNMKISDINEPSKNQGHTENERIKINETEILEFLHRKADGSVADVEVFSSSIVTGGRELVHSIVYDATIKKKNQRMVRLLSQSVEQSPVSTFITGKNGIIEYVNPAFTKNNNYKPEDVIGKNPRFLNSGHHPPEFFKDLWDTILSGKTWEGELRNQKKGGELYWVKAIISPIDDEAGNITHFVSVREDISERKKMIQDMLEAIENAETSEKSLKEAQSIARLGNWHLNITKNHLSWSDEIYRIFGCDPQEFRPTYEAFLGFVHPDDQDMVNNSYVNSLETKSPYNIEHRIVTRNGEVKWVLEKCNTTFDMQGKPLESFGVVIDITDRRINEERVLQYYKIMEESLNEIYIFDAETLKFIMVNKGARENLGYTWDELKNMTVLSFSPQVADNEFAEMHRSLNEGTKQLEVLYSSHTRKDGSTYPVEVFAQKSTFNGRPAFISFANDITERVEYEKQIREANSSLRDMVYVASHDLQVPLVSMEGYASELLHNYGLQLDDEGRYCLSRLKSNAQRMHKLVLSLLDMSRLNTVKNHMQEIDLTMLVDKILKDLALTIDNHNATVKHGELPKISGDQHRIETVLRNLFANALIYGGKNIRVGFNGKAIFVEDDGIGLPAGQEERIFSPGERLKISKADGVGMGLTFCRKVIEQHDGKIYAKSDGQGLGCTFFIELPGIQKNIFTENDK